MTKIRSEIEVVMNEAKESYEDFETEWINSADRSKLPDLNFDSYLASTIEQWHLSKIPELFDEIIELKKDKKDLMSHLDSLSSLEVELPKEIINKALLEALSYPQDYKGKLNVLYGKTVNELEKALKEQGIKVKEK